MNTMKAVVKTTPARGKDWEKGFRLVEKEVPRIEKATDVKMRVVAAAVCGTDVGIYNSKDSLREEMSVVQKSEIIVGHEFCGTIVDAGADARFQLAKLLFSKSGESEAVADYVRGRNPAEIARDKNLIEFLNDKFYSSAEMHISCGTCYQCRIGEKHVCRNTIIKGIQDDGAYAEFLTVPAENVRIYYDSEIPPGIIAFMDAIGNATHTVQSVDIQGKNVAVLGCGVQGLMATAAAKYAGAKRIFVTDASHGKFSHEKLTSSRFRLARLYGADECFDVHIDREREAFYQTVKERTDNTGVDIVFEMSGNYKAYEDAFRVVRMGGVISLLGLPGGQMVVDFSKDIIFRGITIHGIIGRRVFETWDLMEKMLKSGLSKEFLDSGFITHDLPLEKYEEAFQAITEGDAVKVLLRP